MEKFRVVKTYSSFPRNVQIMVLSELALATAFGIYSFLQILYLSDISIPSNKIGLIFSIGSLFSMLGFFLGPFINMFGRKTILIVGCLLSALGIGSYVLFTNYFLLLLSQILTNIGLCFIQVTELQLLYSYTTPDKECCAYSYKSSVNFIASNVGALLAGNITNIPIFSGIGYGTLFFSSVILILVAFTLRLFLLPKDMRIKADNGMIKESILDAITLLKSHKLIRTFALFLFIIAIGGSAVWPYNNLILKNQFGLSNTYISIINFTITTLNMIGVLIMPTTIEKFGIKKFEVTSLLALSISMILLSFSFSKNIFIIMLIIRCASACLVGSSLASSMMSHIELDNRDVFAGVKLLVNGLACAIGNFIGGFIIEKINFRGIYIYGFFILIIVISFFYIKVSKLFDHSLIIERYKGNCNCHLKHKYIQHK